MTITIITPAKNSEKYIKETIESIVFQGGDFSLQYIIIDGHSSDNTLKIIQDYQNFISSSFFSPNCISVSIELISEEDNGIYDAVSKGFVKVKGDIIGIMNSDDVYYPGALSAATTVFSQYKNVYAMLSPQQGS